MSPLPDFQTAACVLAAGFRPRHRQDSPCRRSPLSRGQGGMERRLAPHLCLWHLQWKVPRLSALHRGVLNPGTALRRDRYRPHPSQLLTGGLASRGRKPLSRLPPTGGARGAAAGRSSGAPGCADYVGPHPQAPPPAPSTERLRKTPLGELEFVEYNPVAENVKSPGVERREPVWFTSQDRQASLGSEPSTCPR